MSSRPVISVVIPTYNRAQDLARALRSICDQTYTQWEVLVVDNHSTDDTDKVVQSFQDPRITQHKIHNDGVIAASRNLGIRLARGEYVAFLDSDDWWLPRKLQASLQYLEAGADVVYHDLFSVTKPGQRMFLRKRRTRALTSPVFRDLIVNGNGVGNSSAVIRTQLLLEIGGLSEDRDVIAAEDYDAWLRLAKRTERFRRVPETLGYYWSGGGNISNPEQFLRSLGAIEKKYAGAIRDLNGNGPSYWFSYAKGRACYRLGAYDAARANLELVGWNDAPLPIWLRSCWMLWVMKALSSVSR